MTFPRNTFLALNFMFFSFFNYKVKLKITQTILRTVFEN
ncbi:Uncharacterized protein dnm_100860 [Desulfonema magnum]|uniref:Uncharacterized protein n=1 Tax=Desulfonema magnum TaxID=45655 RepID=A0A975BY89_9BACT|nr:Uncharacterized protein dnm_100860 [Desulfonema magnum]